MKIGDKISFEVRAGVYGKFTITNYEGVIEEYGKNYVIVSCKEFANGATFELSRLTGYNRAGHIYFEEKS